jgi:hypothetical protein
MALQIRKGTNAERLAIVPLTAELLYTTDTKNVYVGDGLTIGGVAVSSVQGPAILEAALYPTSAYPLNPQTGWIIFDTTLNQFVGYNGTAWVAMSL